MKDLGSAFGASVPDCGALRRCQQHLVGEGLVSNFVGPTTQSTVLRSPQAGRTVSWNRIELSLSIAPCERSVMARSPASAPHRAGRSMEEAAQCDRRCLCGAFGSIEETSATSEAVTSPSLPLQWMHPRTVKTAELLNFLVEAPCNIRHLIATALLAPSGSRLAALHEYSLGGSAWPPEAAVAGQRSI